MISQIAYRPLRRLALATGLTAAAAALLLGALGTSSASAAFEIIPAGEPGGVFAGVSDTQAGGHPEGVTDITLRATSAGKVDGGDVKDIVVDLPPGVVGNPEATDKCTAAELASAFAPVCPQGSQVGIIRVRFADQGPAYSGLWSMVPPPGKIAEFGFRVRGQTYRIVFTLQPGENLGEYSVRGSSLHIPQYLPVTGATVEVWGVPADPSHDIQRCFRAREVGPDDPPACIEAGDGPDFGPHSADYPREPFFTNPTACDEPKTTTFFASPWPNPSLVVSREALSPTPTGCERLSFVPAVSVEQATDQAETPTGLEFELKMPSEGLLNPDGLAEAHVKKAEVTLPRGVTLNPSAGEGLAGCSLDDLARETATSGPGEGCPNPSKIASVEATSPLLSEPVTGSVYIAEPDDPGTPTPGAENPFDSLIAMYIVVRNTERGIVVKVPGKVAADPSTGQLTTTFDNLPQLPFDRFYFKFREGGRAPLVSPPTCGTYFARSEFHPWSAADPDNPTPDEIVTITSPFQVTRGVGGGPCPTGGVPPFKPGLTAGTINNAAGTYSPFNVRLSRNDGEQEFTHFSIKLPPGITGKLAGVPFCADAAIEAAKLRTGAQELASPSCPKASEVGRTLVGAGVGSLLTYVPGKIYLAGPYNGSALSIAAITAAKVGPFDVGTVVVRQALKINPETAEVFIDATGSDPIPHIIDGIVVHARDIRAYVDRPQFVLNPTSCKRTSTASTVLGSGLDFASEADNQPITVTSPFQAADCAALGFKPKLKLSLIGGTKRGDNPKFKAVLNARPGDANIGKAQVTLPHSAFLDQSHIKTICTRVQFAAGTVPGEKCPAGSIYGYAKATTPLLDDPIEGPVFLRSSSNNLPDLVAALHNGKININVVGRIDSVGDGQIRNTFESVPDAPVTRFTLTMQGGKKGLLINSTNLCKGKNRATVKFQGHNGKVHNFKPVLKPQCGKKAKKKNEKR